MIALSKAAEFSEFVATHPESLVVFEGPDCIVCRRLDPMLAAFERHASGIPILTVDVSEYVDIAAEHDVRGLPTLLHLKGGVPIQRRHGFSTSHELVKWTRKE